MEFKGDKTKVGLYLSGQEIEVPGANIFITQPTIKQIVSFGEDNFLITIGLLIKTENLIKQLKQGNSELERYSDFQLLMIVLREDASVRQLVQNLFELIFPKYKIEILDFGINFITQDEEGKDIFVGQVHSYNFEVFKILLSDLFMIHGNKDTEEVEFNPIDDRAAEIAKKLQRGREKRAEQRGPQSLYGIYCSVLSIGLGMDINIFFNYTPFQLYDAYNRYMSKQQSDFYIRVSTMPFMDVSKMERPEEWSRHLY